MINLEQTANSIIHRMKINSDLISHAIDNEASRDELLEILKKLNVSCVDVVSMIDNAMCDCESEKVL